MQEFRCRSCQGDTVLHIGTVVRAYNSQSGLTHEPINLYACSDCTVVFFSPPRFGGEDESDFDPDQESPQLVETG